MPRALITGASSGIGACFAECFAEEGFDLVLVARSKERLDRVAADLTGRYSINVETVIADVEKVEDIEKLEAMVASEDRPVDFLVNNAGFGIKGKFTETPIEEHLSVMNVNAIAVLRLAHAALGAMTKRGGGGVINVSSVAAFTPGIRPSSTYAAAKAFVASFTEGLAPSLRGTGVHMSAVCPGWTKSAFHSSAGIGASKIPSFMWLTPQGVARIAIADHRSGKVLSVPGVVYKVIVGVCRAIPRSLITAVANLAGRFSH